MVKSFGWLALGRWLPIASPKRLWGKDGLKLLVLFVGSLAMMFCFVGQGLTLDNYQFFLSLRLPKLLAIVLAAVAIATSSLVFQTLTNNRILTPSILGFDSLYQMLQTVMLVVLGSSHWVILNPLGNFLATTSVMIFFSLLLFQGYFKKAGNNLFTLMLVGIVCGSLFSSISSFLTMVIDPDEFAILQTTMFASFNTVNAKLVYWSAIPLILCMVGLFWHGSSLDVLWLGADNATSMGIDVPALTKRLMVLITIMISVATALVGPVLFFGLVVVSLTRHLFSSYRHTVLLIGCSLLSIVMLVFGQWFVEKVLAFQTTISVIINFVGGIYFLLLLLRNRVH